MTTGSIVVSFIAIIGIILVLILFLRFVPLGLWISARAAGVRVRIVSLIACASVASTPLRSSCR